jgi:hypothetical protein
MNKGEIGRRLAQKALMPIVASAASAAAGYAAKKGPDLFEEKVLPKLKQEPSGASSVAEDLPTRGRSAAGKIDDIADDLTSRVKDAAPIDGGGDQRRNGALTPAELERHLKSRARARAARRGKATSKR